MTVSRLFPAAIALIALSGCEDGFNLGGGGGNSSDDSAAVAAAGPGQVNVIEQDVEKPDIFSVTEPGLWDGRPSLGGIWVAHPDVEEPERVIIRNTQTDINVTGALFRREREAPGPRLQVSSDAAQALGIVAGQPTELNVVAVRTEQVEVVVEAPPEAATEGLEAPGAIETQPLDGADPIAGAAAAIDAAEAGATATPAASLDRPFIQAATSTSRGNADAAAARLTAEDLPARVVASGNAFRILVGPASSTEERARLLAAVRSEGFTDAFIVAN
ncbi:SPOR domain-containing protein [Aestuariibius sp. 2305UL40-4]|uniref:SPOR domain-containing protein n=1 Tax=Aestuariibius violaceus TaxID=3234132 RepID=UPI00345E5459